MTAASPANYTQEVRFAVVMYGGVSLAIYINGIAQELLRLVRSTASGRDPQNNPSGTERVYRKVSYLLDSGDYDVTPAEEKLLEEAAGDPALTPPTRFVVDILSGTSAGGINGIFLAKALANGQDMDQLQDLWIQQGDIDLLINDKRSIEKPLSLQDPPASLLNSERMFYQLLKAFEEMDKSCAARSESDPSPLVDELDLYVTSTDLQGVVLPIRLSDALVYERRYRNVLHFVYSSPGVSGEETTRNDFHGNYNPFLAYAARCTSSFPFAFEPMSLCDMDALLDVLPGFNRNISSRSSSDLWQRFYRDYLDPRGVSTVPFPQRAFGDGGYLDNKPFSYATETLMNRNADVPVDRKLIYIEPSPEHPEDDVEKPQKPDAIQNVVKALLTLPRYETIREDLQRVKDRNRLIERVNTIAAGVDRDEDVVRHAAMVESHGDEEAESRQELGALALPQSHQLWAQKRLSDEEVGKLQLSDMVKRKGRAYAAYQRLRISAVTDELAALVARVAGFDENSDYFMIVRSLVRGWRVLSYVDNRDPNQPTGLPTTNQFLFEFDLSYPIRRINYLRNKADSLYRFDKNLMPLINLEVKTLAEGATEFTDTQKDAFRADLLDSKKKLNDLFVDLRLSARSLRSRHGAKDEIQKRGTALIERRIESVEASKAEKGLEKVSPVARQVKDLVAKIEARVREILGGNDSSTVILDYFLGKSWRLPEGGTPIVTNNNQTADEECTARCEAFLKATTNQYILQAFQTTAEAIKTNVKPVKTRVEGACDALFSAPAIAALSASENDYGVVVARECLGHFYENYEDYDQLVYPILYDTDVGETDIVDLIRISPEDAKQLIDERDSGCLKLAGTALGHFGAFLAKLWRQNDILWGRLDGAERLISALLPNHPMRDRLIGEAQAEIVLEAIEPMGEEERQTLLVESLMRTKSRQPEPDLLMAFIRNLMANSHNLDLKQKLASLIDDKKLRQFYLDAFAEQSRLQPQSTLRSSARATTVIGKILESLSSNRRVSTKYGLWVARLGQVLWALVEVAVPRSFPDLFFRHWLKLVYFLEVLLLVGSTLLLATSVQQFALSAFGITVAIHIAVDVLRDIIQSRNRWLNLGKAMAIAILVTLILVGGLALSAVLGAQFSWNFLTMVRNFFISDQPVGLNSKTFLRAGVILLVLVVFLWSIRSDLKVFFTKNPA
jgi:patatin-related protein